MKHARRDCPLEAEPGEFTKHAKRRRCTVEDLGDGTCEVTTMTGHTFLVDEEDAVRVADHHWSVTIDKVTGRMRIYAATTGRRQEQLARFILRETLELGVRQVEYKNRDPFDNRKYNLHVRLTSEELSSEQKGAPHNFEGVEHVGGRNPYQAFLTVRGKKVVIGQYLNPESAAAAYDCALMELEGENAACNL